MIARYEGDALAALTVVGRLEFDRLDDDGDVWAAKVWPDDHSDRAPAVVVELMSVLGDDWWAAHADDVTLMSGHGGSDKQKVGEHHPAELRALLGKKLKITIEVIV